MVAYYLIVQVNHHLFNQSLCPSSFLPLCMLLPLSEKTFLCLFGSLLKLKSQLNYNFPCKICPSFLGKIHSVLIYMYNSTRALQESKEKCASY